MELKKNKKDHTGLFFMTLLLLGVFSFLFLLSRALAQDPGFDHTAKFEDRWRKEGNLVTVQITKAQPLRIFVLGREEAKVDLSKLKITVRRIKPYPGKILKINQFNNYYTIADPAEIKKATDLEITTHFKNQDETFNFQLNQDVHEK